RNEIFTGYLSEPCEAQQRRARVSGSGQQTVEFDCPEEFGYYSHPTDCTQYYVCVFGGALLESCTGGLMYSQELQTCDWPRNVGCGAEGESATISTVRVTDPRTRHTTPTGSRFMVSTVHQNIGLSVVLRHKCGGTHLRLCPANNTVYDDLCITQYYANSPALPVEFFSRLYQIPLLRVYRKHDQSLQGPTSWIKQQANRHQLYADDLGPAEEVESDRQQRVYRGQPSTVGQVARDRDGLRHQVTNAIPVSTTNL
ncbi:hypothetical protein L9F63_012543, partial [Diploptera punctata]